MGRLCVSMSSHSCLWILHALFVVAMLYVACSPAHAQRVVSDAPKRPNILWLIAEDMGPDLGVYGTPEARTPNLNALADRGMLFTQAFSTSPVCSPSRSAIMTGMYQTTIGAHNHRSHRKGTPSPYPWPLPDSVRLLTDWLRHAGYFTGNIVHFPEPIDFEGTGKTDWNFTYRGKPFDTDRWSELKKHQPFYAQINFSETHRGHAWEAAQEKVDHPADPEEVRLPPYYPDHPVARREWAEYLNTVMVLDEKVGAVLELLEEQGLAENTVVIFMSDHGRAMLRAKQWPYDSGLHIPLIVYWPVAVPAPEQYEAGTVSNQLISTLDITTTTMATAGVPRPEEKTQGRVFFGEQAGPPRLYVFGGRDRGDETVDRMRTVRSRRFRYIRNYYPERPYLQKNRYKEANYPILWLMRKLHREGELSPKQARFMAEERPREELYDLMKDPYEMNNRADSAAYQEILGQMRRVLDRWIERTGDQGRFPEDPEVVEYYRQRMERLYDDSIERLSEKWGIPPVQPSVQD